MTRARALKQIVRARAAKTGERYTTARRHVLKGLIINSAATGSPAPIPATRAPAPTKGSVSDATAREKTGHGLDHWFAVLDRFDGIARGHTASARHLYEDHKVPSWHAQGITVAYERARGARTLNQRMSGGYEVSITKTVSAGTEAVVRAFTDARRRAKWLPQAGPKLSASLVAALTSTAKGFVIRPDRQGRFRYKWDDTTVQFNLLPKGEERTSVVVTHLKLADAEELEKRRAEWRSALAALARTLGD